MNCKQIICRQYFKEARVCLFVQLNGFKYSYLTLIILFNITHSFAQLNGLKYCNVTLSIQHQSFVCTQLND